jgi:MYXO-CTERM domain-containing protein
MGAVLSRIAVRPHTRVGAGGAVLTALGLVTVAVGTFLPWVRSGSVLRDSYQSIAVIRTIKVVDGSPLSLVLDAWTLLIPTITVCVVLYALGLRRSAATISVLVAIISGTVAGAATVVSGGEEIRLGIASFGPVTTTVGAVVALVGVVGIFAGRRRRATENAGGEP